MAYQNTQAIANRPPTDVAGVTGAETISPEIIALTQAFLMASPEITLPQAVKAAYFFHNTGQVEGRDSYIGTSGRVTGKVLEGYRGVARDAAERGVGEVQIKYRPLTADEAEWHEVKPGDLARACEVYQLKAWRIAQSMGQTYEPIIGIGIVKPGEKTDSSGKPIPLIGGMTWGKKCQNRAYKDAMRHVPGMAISAAEVLEDAEERGYHIEPPPAAQLTREQAIALVQEAERLSIAPPQPVSAEQAIATLATNNAKTRGTGPDWQGFGDDDERPAASAPTQNGKTTQARPHWNSVDDAVLWGYDQGAFKAIQHAQNAYNKLRAEAKASDNPPKNAADMFNRWHADVLLRLERAKANTITDAELDGADMVPAVAGEDDEPQF